MSFLRLITMAIFRLSNILQALPFLELKTVHSVISIRDQTDLKLQIFKKNVWEKKADHTIFSIRLSLVLIVQMERVPFSLFQNNFHLTTWLK